MLLIQLTKVARIAVVVCVASAVLFGADHIAFSQTVLGGAKFPITISKPGSYILKHNLVPPANTTAINITANNVSIEPNGFAIIGTPSIPNVWAINQTAGSGVIVRNGQVSGLCIGLGQNALVEDVIAVNCTSTDAIDVGPNSSVLRSQALNGHDSGIVCGGLGSNCLFADDIAAGNPINGITCLGNGCNFTRNTTNGNGAISTGNGLDCNGSACLFNGNVSNNNLGSGIAVADHTSAATNNVLNGNGFLPFGGAISFGNNLCNGSVC
jgi:hypothetical protein